VQSVLAAAPGFNVPDIYAGALVFVGLAVVAAVGALSHERDRAFSASLIYLALGLGAAVMIQLFDLRWLDPVDDAVAVRRLAEFAVIVALFSTGLKLDRELSWRGWASVARLLGIAMPLTIAAVAAFGALAMGLSLGAAIVLGAALSPTDPVLADDIGVGPPGEEEEREPNFAITAEAGLNDGLAYPFVLLGLLVAARGDDGWFPEWVLADLLWSIAGGVAIGAGMGYGAAALAVRLRDRRLLASEYDGWLALATVLVIYGATEVATAYGFLAAFAGGLAFRRYEHGHELNARVHTGAEVTEKFGELAVILLLGSMVTLSGVGQPGLSGWLLVPLLLLVVRPAAVLVSLLGSHLRRDERLFLAWFGVRGIGSLYYATATVAIGGLVLESEVTLVWTVWVCVLCSVVVHGVTAAPFTRRLLDRAEKSVEA
jgi:NhaP-type Na+/H+ or K+/H+ antiporter